jgi:hypothetical protein
MDIVIIGIPKMPKKANGAKRAASEKKNKDALEEALSMTNPIVGRVEKNLGNCAFQVTIKHPENNGPKTVQGLIRGVFKGGSRSEGFCAPGVFVILAPSESRSEVHEIVGIINKRKDLKALKDSNKMPVCLQDAEGVDDLFDFDDTEEVEDEEKVNLAKKESARVTAGRKVDDEVGLDEL